MRQLLSILVYLACQSIMSTVVQAADHQPILSTDSLQTRLTEPAVVVLDTRPQESYAEAHIPGSRWIDSETWRSKTFEETGLQDKAYWDAALQQAGLKAEEHIVIVGESLPETARAWWLLKYLGMSHVSVLDGGYKAWTQAELPTQAGEPPAVEPSEIAVEFQPSMLAVIDELMPVALEQNKTRILDNRSTAEFTGSRGIGTRTGHIPRSIHLEWKEFLDEDGKFLPAEKIVDLLKQKDISLEEPIVALCQSAGRSSVAALALEAAGAKNVKNYYRGWGDYAATLTAPVETGEARPSQPTESEIAK